MTTASNSKSLLQNTTAAKAGATTRKRSTKRTRGGAIQAPTDIQTLAAQALASIAGVVSSIPLDNVTAAQAKAARVANVVPTAAISIAANVVAQNPALFSTIDPATITGPLEYEQAIAPLLVQVEQLRKRLTSTLNFRKGAAAAQTLALYASMKALSRTAAPPALAAEEAALAKALGKRRPARSTNVTVPETTQAVRAIRATKVAATKAALAAKAEALSTEAASLATTALGALPGRLPATNGPSPNAPPPTTSH